MSPSSSDTSQIKFASMRCRLFCMIYEAVLLFGIFFAAGLLFDLSTQNQNADSLHSLRQLYLFVVLGIYFTYFWGHGGQTLPMKTWHLRVVSGDGAALSLRQAGLRYCLAWMWFLPALALSHFLTLSHWTSVILFFVGMLCWALTALLDQDRQFLHDKLAGTCLIAVARTRLE